MSAAHDALMTVVRWLEVQRLEWWQTYLKQWYHVTSLLKMRMDEQDLPSMRPMIPIPPPPGNRAQLIERYEWKLTDLRDWYLNAPHPYPPYYGPGF